MNGAHWHLVVNHIPIIFPIAGILILLTGIISKSEAVKRSAFLLLIVGALATVAAMSTGEGAEEVVENISGISENYIENHEETAERFALLNYLVGFLSLAALFISMLRKSVTNIITYVILIVSLVSLYFGKLTGTTGGEIRHTEIRQGNLPITTEGEEHEDED